MEASYYANISKIINYFKRTPKNGFLFCACNNALVIKQVNHQIILDNDLNIKEVYLSSKKDNFLDLIRKKAEEKPDGLIITNLDELILITKGRIIQNINFAREILIEMAVPMLFWLSETNISRMANNAFDLFQRRDRGVVKFKLAGDKTLDRFKDNLSPEYRTTQDYKSLEIKIELLKKQLQEAEQKGYAEKRIAFEIVADLIGVYLQAFLRDEAEKLFKQYKNYLAVRPNAVVRANGCSP